MEGEGGGGAAGLGRAEAIRALAADRAALRELAGRLAPRLGPLLAAWIEALGTRLPPRGAALGAARPALEARMRRAWPALEAGDVATAAAEWASLGRELYLAGFPLGALYALGDAWREALAREAAAAGEPPGGPAAADRFARALVNLWVGTYAAALDRRLAAVDAGEGERRARAGAAAAQARAPNGEPTDEAYWRALERLLGPSGAVLKELLLAQGSGEGEPAWRLVHRRLTALLGPTANAVLATALKEAASGASEAGAASG